MKTKHLPILFAIALSFALFSCQSNKTEEAENIEELIEADDATHVSFTYQIDTENSKVGWKGSMIGVYSHEGDLLFKEGHLSINGGQLVEGAFTADMTSMVTTDDDALYKMASREKLIGHLSAPDFFSTEEFPTATFLVKSHSGNTVTGDLTIRGMTNEETITDVIIVEENGTFTATGNLVFDRQLYNVSYEHKMSDMVLSDDIELTISLSGSAE